MDSLHFVCNYKDHEPLRESFFRLAKSIFGLELARWYEAGFWKESYIPYSYAEDGKIVANVSVNLLELTINGVKSRAVQLGTVMTHPDYRGRGLSAQLMNRVLEDYGQGYEIMYLFANDSVLEFYPKFGFKPVDERLFSMDCPRDAAGSAAIRKLDLADPHDLNLFTTLGSQRIPVSQRLGVSGVYGLLMFYGLNVFSGQLYYLENEKVIAICQQENGQLEIFDLISTQPVSCRDMALQLADSNTEKIVFHFTPDDPGLELSSSSYSEGLFVRNQGSPEYPSGLKHPATYIG